MRESPAAKLEKACVKKLQKRPMQLKSVIKWGDKENVSPTFIPSNFLFLFFLKIFLIKVQLVYNVVLIDLIFSYQHAAT